MRLFFTRPRLRLRFSDRQVGALPSFGPLGVPGYIGIAVGQDAFRRVPGHPAIFLTVDHEQRGLVAAGSSFKSPPQVGLGCLCQFAVAGIRQPDAAGNVEPRLVAPHRARGKILRLWRTRQHVDESTRACAPDRFGLRGRQHAHAGERCRNRRAVIVGAISVRLRHVLLRVRFGCERKDRNHHTRKPPDHGDFVAVSAPIGRSFSSSKGTPKSSRILLMAGWFSWIRPLSCRFQFWSAGRTPMPMR